MNWISVEDQLPDKFDQVLAYCVGDFLDQCECIFLEDFGIWNVTHWMPLPAPPTGEPQ